MSYDETRQAWGQARIVCGCEECVRPCMAMPGHLLPEDLPFVYQADQQRIAPELSKEVDWLEWAGVRLLASPGAVVALADGSQWRVPTLVPGLKRSRQGCVWLSESGKCEIHTLAPFGCAFFSSHEARDELAMKGLQRLISVWQHKEMTPYDALYRAIWHWLSAGGRMAEPPELLQAQLATRLQ